MIEDYINDMNMAEIISNYIKILIDENEELQERINKASELLIKFCNENQPYLDEVEDCCKTKINDILKKLKGIDEE